MLFLVPCPSSLVPAFMKLVLAILAVLIIAASVFADWKWRRWMAARKRERDQNQP